MSVDSDDTVRLRVKRRGDRGPVWPWLIGAGVGTGLAASGLWWSLHPGPPAIVVADAASQDEPKPALDQLNVRNRNQLSLASPPGAQTPPAYAPTLASEAEILADSPEQLAVYRFVAQPSVVVLQFPTLAEQALTLNRVAALIEKAGFSHDQVLARAELDSRIVAAGGKPEEFYYGHDYSSADLVRFFSLARDLNPQEQSLQRLVQKLGWNEPAPIGALVTLVRQSAGSAALDSRSRAAILRHELSHGLYFTSPEYSGYCGRFWRDTLTADERAKFTAFLAREGYDTSIADLMTNEMQAYLMHTPDARFFSPAEVGISSQRVAELRQIFLVGMPPGWLRDSTTADRLP